MTEIVAIATPNSYAASLGALVDAHARLGELFATNASLGDYARMQTRLIVAPSTGDQIQLSGNLRVEPAARLADVEDARIVYLPSFQLLDLAEIDGLIEAHAPLHTWLVDMAARGAHFGAAGAGILHLAAAGLVDGLESAVPPRLAKALRSRFPRARFRTDQTLCASGNVTTCAHDADCPGLVLRLFADAFSLSLAQSLAERAPAQSLTTLGESSADPLVTQACVWIRERFTQNFRIGDLAAELGVSHQTLIRRFREAGRGSPRAFAQQARMQAAASMLAETRRSIAEIAQLVGYADIASFRRVFRTTNGLTPGDYRKAHRRASS